MAVTEQQIADRHLLTTPPKAGDRRSFSGTSTTQAQALPPEVLADVLGKSMSPDCGNRYQRSASDKPDGRYRGTATATWSIAWTAPALCDEGEFTETQATAWTAWVGEVQVLDTN
ncbi:hypothetical protein ACIOHB_37690 [Streptomyces microflavus]|uniref:hypothetical protein n=1 Tax=Streptomyces microflavus TaxID=1919 RepID=UPI00382E748D